MGWVGGVQKDAKHKGHFQVFFKVYEEEGTTSLSKESTKYKKRWLFWYPTML